MDYLIVVLVVIYFCKREIQKEMYKRNEKQ